MGSHLGAIIAIDAQLASLDKLGLPSFRLCRWAFSPPNFKRTICLRIEEVASSDNHRRTFAVTQTFAAHAGRYFHDCFELILITDANKDGTSKVLGLGDSGIACGKYCRYQQRPAQD